MSGNYDYTRTNYVRTNCGVQYGQHADSRVHNAKYDYLQYNNINYIMMSSFRLVNTIDTTTLNVVESSNGSNLTLSGDLLAHNAVIVKITYLWCRK